ncbi:class I SAM-dependent methyltransferase [Shewanella sedimentimangrovi]|uniref:Class I SAM-dependent methyltransferase n=1 Tax=Shewanella sedimentimangrovi TaxID=2814293 RepID=A0ABX7R5F8_9GAMM|nr:class I SAM-dependent methyltransferase [Shewanella sedimentimangrovi]QSX38410.1 class I SAM-dependent methyltransferase [Shewanella sedimentimangrovi]
MDADVYLRMAAQEEHHWWFVGRRQIIAQQLQHLQLAPDATILEVGAGTGGNLALLSRFGKVQALEPDAGARELVARNRGVTLTPGSLPHDVPFAEGSQDLVVALDVLEHIPDDDESLRQLHRLLRPGGQLLLTVPACTQLWSEHDEQHHHQRRYSAGELKQLLQATGFEVTRCSHFNTLLFPLIFCVRMLKRLLGSRAPDDRMPAPWLNRLLLGVLLLEKRLLGLGLNLPFGVSILLVARKKANAK